MENSIIQGQEEFLGVIAHEMTNPLQAIQNCVNVLTYGELDENGKQCIGVMRRQLDILSCLASDLMDLTRLTTGKMRITLSSCCLPDVMESAIHAVTKIFRDKCHKLVVEVTKGSLKFNSDPIRLQQIFTNLLINAAKYTDPGGQIEFGARIVGDRLVFWVCDNGVGIAPENLEHVFDLFSQEVRSQGKQSGGVGLGLTLVRGLTSALGGEVRVYSEGVGKGSEFVVTLPFNPLGDYDEGLFKEEPMRVLLIDDSHDNVSSMTLLLRCLGHDVVTACDGNSGLRESKSGKFDLVLVDINLPDIVGYDLCPDIRKYNPDARICVLSGQGQQTDQERSREAGFDHHFVKPLSLEALTSYLNDVAA